MGSRFARRWLDAGYGVVGHDAEPAAMDRAVSQGVDRAGSPAEVADRAETVLVSLPTPDVVRTVACGGDRPVLAGARVVTFVDLSTTGPSMAGEILPRVTDRGVAYVDAPVSGGVAGAEAGRLTVIASGSADAIDRVRPVLEVIGSRVVVVGALPGQGQLVKLLNNLLSAASIAVTGEALVLGAKAGLDPAVVLDVINTSSDANQASLDKFPKQVLTRRFDHGFRLDLMAKDVRLCLAEGRARDVPMPVGDALDRLWTGAEGELDAGVDCMALVQLLERWAATTIEPGGHPG
jgi:3-hydroxyisobutyrate dehydrogenase-like beta-hydroxyacid dehydrogenase